MVAKKPPVPQRKLWSLESMAAALKDVESRSKGLREAARTYNVLVETLRRRVEGQVLLECKSGPGTVLTREEEEALSDYCIKMSEMGFGLGREDVMHVAFTIVDKSGRPHCFKSGMAGRGWFEGFMRRFPRLSLRSPQPLSFARARACTDDAIKGFFEKLGGIYARLNLLAKPMQVFNCDETGISVVHNPGRVVTEMGRKKVWFLTSGERGKTHTVITCVSASGYAIPPMMIYPRVRMSDALKAGAVPCTLFGCSKTGWVNQDLYLEWFRFFISLIPAIRPVLLVMDGHCSHISLEVIQLAQENDIHLLCLPSHTSHLLQPLDVGVFKSLKSFYSKACKQFMVDNPGCVVRSENLASLLAVSWSQSVTPLNIMSGFRKSGIYPLNPGVIDDRLTAPSKAMNGAAESEIRTPTSPSSSTNSTAGSASISALTLSDCSQSSGSGGRSSQDLSDILVLPKPSDANSSRKGVNHDAVCITDAEFTDQLKLKELEKRKKQEQAEQRRIQREQKRVEKEQKKAEKSSKRRGRRKGKKQNTDATNREGDRSESGEESDYECPVCGIHFVNDAENIQWIGCDGCSRWWHVTCLDLTEIPDDFFCSDCQ